MGGTHKTLISTLETFRKENIFSLFSECLIYFQGITQEDIDIANQYNLRFIGNSENLGIMGDMEEIAKHSTSKYVLHIENDIQFIQTYDFALEAIRQAIFYMNNDTVDFYRLMGTTDHLRKKYLRYHPAPEINIEDSIAKKIRRLTRPQKAKRLSGHCIYFLDAIDSAVLNWSNLAPLYPKEWFLEEILNFAKSHLSSRLVNNKPDLEKELNCAWWRKKHFRIGFYDGLFQHIRHDKPLGDEKNDKI